MCRPGCTRRGVAAVALALAVTVGCVTPTPIRQASAPRHPEFLRPAVPQEASAAERDALGRAWLALQADDLARAARTYAELRRLPRVRPAVDVGLAYVSLARKQAREAADAFTRVLAETPADVPALVGRGLAFVQLSREADAVSDFTAAVTHDPSLTDVAHRAELLRARVLEDAVARARSAQAAGRMEEARAAFDAALTVAPDAAFLHRERAALERRAGSREAALRFVRRAAALDPADAAALVLLAQLLAEDGDEADALEAYRQARASDPASVPEATLTALERRLRAGALPAPYRAIAERSAVTRAELAAVVGVQFDALLRRQPARAVIVTDLGTHWARRWMELTARAGVMDVFPNGTFEPDGAVRRMDLAEVVARLLALRVPPAAPGRATAGPQVMADVPPTHLGYPAVRAAVDAGVLTLREGRFGLLDPVSGREALDAVARLSAILVIRP